MQPGSGKNLLNRTKNTNINVRFLFPLMALVILVLALSTQLFDLPPFGKLMDPFGGAIQNENDQELNATKLNVALPGLSGLAQVYFDDRKVPHIYAASTADLYFAQGYVTASLRLWQMDFLSYASAGRLSEIFNEGLLLYDRAQRRMGMLDAAKNSLALIEKDPETLQALTAYTKGVNAYINKLDYKHLPFEYKMLDYEPEPWTNLKTVLIMKYVAAMLSGYEEDHVMTNLMLALGEKRYNRLFPAYGTHCTPIMDNPRIQFDSALAYTKQPDYLNYSFWTSRTSIAKSDNGPGIGSNSWVVSGKLSRSGHPILCNDPHLGLSLPAIWLEMQLSAPGINVYGAGIPGLPAVIIGFNRKIAWGITNGEGDAKDWYKLKVTEDYGKYELDGQWHDLHYTIDTIERRKGGPFYDTIYHTVQGPVLNDKRLPGADAATMNCALRWELQKPSNDILTFIRLNKANGYSDYKEAIRYCSSPVINFTFASSDDTIAVNHQGNIPVKWNGQGKFVLDGTKTAHLYQQYIPFDSLPHLVNPERNYVISANQHPTSCNYKYYYNGYYLKSRAERIRQLLEKDSAWDSKKMMAMQLDNVSSFAVDVLPELLNRMQDYPLKGEKRLALDKLYKWNGTYDYNNDIAALFELWWKQITVYTWDELNGYTFNAKTPDDYVLLDMIKNEPADEYFDNLATPTHENSGDIIDKAFHTAFASFIKLQKEGTVKWGQYNKIDLQHMTHLPFFSRMGIPSAGQLKAINSISAGIGPSWRMIVELGDRPKAFGVYPGGQSGNVTGRYYDTFITDWNKGTFYPLNYYLTSQEAASATKAVWTLNNQ